VSVDADATRVNKDGLIESVAADQARLDYDPSSPQDPHLLLEPTRRNIVDYSEEFNQWGLGSGASVTTNQSTSPNGSNTADKITSSASNSRVVRTFSFSNNSTMVFSVFIKNIDATNIKIGISDNITGVCNATFTFSTETITAANQGSWTNTSASVQNFANGWYRLILISTKGAGSNLAPRIEFTETGKNIFAWGAQLEDNGSFGSVNYPTSYIPTAGSQVTRTADTCEKSSVASGIIGQTEGVIFLDFENYGQIGTSYSGYFKIQSDGNNDRVTIQGDGSTLNRLILVVNDGSSTFFQPRTIIPSGRNKVAIRYKSGLVASFINGAKIDTTSTSFSFSNTLNTIQLQQPNKVHQAVVFNEALTDAELITLTS
jgi:hypothetical protein